MFKSQSTGLVQTWIEAMRDTRAAIRTARPRDYLIGLAAAGLATLARWLLDPALGERLPYPTYFLAVAAVSWSGGLLPALVTLLASCLAADWFFIEPRGDFGLDVSQTIGMVTYLVVALVIAVLGDARLRAVAQAEQRRDLVRVTLASIGDAVLVTDADGRVIYLNNVAAKLTGWSETEAVSQPLETVFRIMNELTREAMESPARVAQLENRIVGLANHAVLIARDGSESPIDDSAAPIHDEGGHVIGTVLIFRDISPRRTAEWQLRSSEARKAAILHSALDAIVTIDGAGRIVEINPAAVTLFGYDEQEALGREMASLLIPPDLRERHRAGLARYMRTGEAKLLSQRLEMPALRKDGTVMLVELTITLLQTGPEPLFSGFLRDISQEKEAERQVYTLVTELKQASRRKDEFLATLSHELRNPLSPLRLSLEIMKRAEDDPTLRRQAWQTMDRQLTHLERLVDDLLDVSRITRDVLELRRGRVDLTDVLRQAVEASRPLILSSRHEVHVELPKQPLVLDADPARLVQVFSNLLNNACRYTPAGGRIELSAARQGDTALVSVRDNGSGIPAELLPRIFDMFMQGERRPERSAGIGIGLTLVKRLVEMHGGEVTASSAGRDQGSEFIVRLPLAPASAVESPGPHPARDVRGRPRRILVVDDHVDSATSLATILGLGGHEVRIAHDGPQAIVADAEFLPEVVLLDIGLPSMSGHEVARRIRSQAAGRSILLVAVTGWGQLEDRRKSADSGFDQHMVKPIDIRALLAKLAEG